MLTLTVEPHRVVLSPFPVPQIKIIWGQLHSINYPTVSLLIRCMCKKCSIHHHSQISVLSSRFYLCFFSLKYLLSSTIFIIAIIHLKNFHAYMPFQLDILVPLLHNFLFLSISHFKIDYIVCSCWYWYTKEYNTLIFSKQPRKGDFFIFPPFQKDRIR